MSTGSDHSDRYENSPLGQQYVIRLHSKEEICLHALSILQADLLPCYLPAYLSEDETELIIDSNGSIPLSELKGKDKAFVEKNYRKLLTSYLSDLIRSLDHSLSLSGICYLEEKLFYNRITKRIVCIYLPLKSRLLKKTVLLSKLDESALDELLHVPYEKKWITQEAMKNLYSYFRKNDEASAVRYLQGAFWEDARAFPSHLRRISLIFSLFLVLYAFGSRFIEKRFSESPLSSLPDLLFFLCTASLFLCLFLHIRKSSSERQEMTKEQTKRRKTRNAQMLFPTSTKAKESGSDKYAFSKDPVQFESVAAETDPQTDLPRFTVWLNTLLVGSDSDCCDLAIDHPSLALCHAVFAHDKKGFYIEALQEAKGTFLNRRRLPLNEKAYLQQGDIVGLGDLEYRTLFLHEKEE